MSMDLVVIDFETYYDADFSLSKITTEEYVRSDLFEAIGFAIKRNDEPTQWVSGTHAELKEWLHGYTDWSKAMVLAHNTMFDGAILSWRFDVHPAVYLDTLCMGRAVHGIEVGGSLKAMAERYGVGVKGEEVVHAKGKRRLDFSEAELSRYAEYCINDVELTLAIFKKMLRGFPKQELKLIDTTLRMFVEPVLELDLPLLEQHLEEVKGRKEALLQSAEVTRDVLLSNPKFAELLREQGVEPPMKVSPTTGKQTLALAKNDEAFKALSDHPNEVVQVLVAARLGTKSTLEETRTQRFIDIAKRGALPVPLKYYGARTGRWAAEGSINMQNVPRGSTLKQAILAPKGYVMVGADLSNIELRVGLWLAGQHDKLELLSKGVDLYKDFASSVFNVPYNEVTKDQRFIGKTSQLSLIYGVGALKLRSAIKAGSGVDIGEDEARRIVDLYRSEYSDVKRIWVQGGRAIEAIYNNQTMNFGYGGVVSIDGADGVLLPSKLHIRYDDLQHTVSEEGAAWTYAIRRGRDKIYGAKLFQGLTQATARCIMGEQMITIAKHYKIVLTVHDAVYALAKVGDADTALEFILRTMRTPPSWLPGIVLDAEGSYGERLSDC